MLVLIIFGSLRIQSERFHILPAEIGISLLAVSLLVTSLVMIWITANRLNKADDRRSQAEEEIRSINTNLEITVEERSAKLKELYAELQKSEERYRSLFEHASDAIYVLSSTGDFKTVNDSVCNMTGYSRDELLKMNIKSLLSAEILQNYPLVYTEIEPGKSIIAERKIIKKGGDILDVEINIKKFVDERILVIARDITERKLMEAELRTAEVKFRTLAEKSMMGIYIVQNARFVYVNPRFAEIFGYKPDELIGAYPVEAIIHPDYQPIVVEKVRLRKEEGVESVHYEAMGKKKDGSSNWVEFYGSRTFFEDEPTFIGSMIDITDRKKAEDELKISEQKYKLLFDSNPVPLWIVAKDDMKVMTANNAAATLYGYAPEELQGMDVKQLRPVKYWDKLVTRYHADLNDATDFGVIEHVKKDGTPILVNIIAQDIIFEGRLARLSSTNDVTEKLKAEELLKKSEANLQTILNNTDTAYALLDAELDLVEYNNTALVMAKHEFNFEPGSTGKIFDLMPDDRRLQFLQYTAEVFKGNTISYEVSYQQPNDGDLWYYVRMFPIANKGNEILGLVLAINDITERKTAEQDLQVAYQTVQSHIDKILEMTWKQSHLIRSPLANLRGLFPMVKEDPTDQEVLGYMEAELKRMDEILWEMAESTALIGTNNQSATIGNKA
jgi:PAS domain S-box-containing protein